jgi:DNA-binding transcriptional LysR family regulator
MRGHRQCAIAAILLSLTSSGCGVRIPSDPDGTQDRVTDSVLRVGASPSGSLVHVGGHRVSGSMADLVEGFAASRGARLEWRVDSEEDLVGDLESGRIDLAIGGMTADTPWATRVSVTRGYPDVDG